MLAYYMITGGVAKYLQLLVEAGAFTLDTILNEIFSDNSLSQNEIDIKALNESEKRLGITEVKRKAENINIAELKRKADSLVKQFENYTIEYEGLSMENM